MKFIDLTIPFGVGTPPWPTYEPLQVKYFKRLAPNGANGQLLTHSNHLGTHLDGDVIEEINRQPVGDPAEYEQALAELGPQERVMLFISRRGARSFVVVGP